MRSYGVFLVAVLWLVLALPVSGASPCRVGTERVEGSVVYRCVPLGKRTRLFPIACLTPSKKRVGAGSVVVENGKTFKCQLSLIPVSSTQAAPSTHKPLEIASYNVQVFGQRKAQKPEVMNVLVSTIRQFDLISILEIRDSKETAVNTLLARVNSGLPASQQYAMVVGQREGRSNSKEQNAFLYRKSRLSVEKYETYSDPKDRFERAPFIVSFKTKDAAVSSFVMVGAHTLPAQAQPELNAMVEVYEYAKKKYKQMNILLSGDFNAGCSYLTKTKLAASPLRTNKSFKWHIKDDMDTTVGASSCAYDRFISTGTWSTQLSNGRVIRYDKAPSGSQKKPISSELAKQVSDRYPIAVTLQ